MVSTQQQFESLIRKRFPVFLDCCNDFQKPTVRDIDDALDCRFININKTQVHALIIDLDKGNERANLAWMDENLPPPTWVTINNMSGHGHMVWLLDLPVSKDHRRRKSMEWFEAIRRGYTRRLGGDRGYSNGWTRNPLYNNGHLSYHPSGHTLGYWSGETYTLNELDSYLDQEDKAFWPQVSSNKVADTASAADVGSRNNQLFNAARLFAYQIVRQGGDGVDLDQSLAEFLRESNEALLVSLSEKEVGWIHQSIYRYCMQNRVRLMQDKNSRRRGPDQRPDHCRKVATAKARESRARIWVQVRGRRSSCNVSLVARTSGTSRPTVRKHLNEYRRLMRKSIQIVRWRRWQLGACPAAGGKGVEKTKLHYQDLCKGGELSELLAQLMQQCEGVQVVEQAELRPSGAGPPSG